ncbi:MAG: ankyrin repeat domain-containing protein [Oligoflexia bacterium]|nr:ankyrin repeat domain-containing protein [Oligoflexia bacterium]MBF0365242.1 ankyrin repeat domain-containing protein [Oligoflexia bacterium]
MKMKAILEKVMLVMMLFLPLITFVRADGSAKIGQTNIDFSQMKAPTPLENAVIANDFQLVSKLASKANVNVQTNSMGGPLMLAVYNDNFAIAELLLKRGASVETKMSNGITPLFLAVTRNQVTLVKLLLDYKANPNYAVAGIYPIDVAISVGYLGIEEMLKQKGAKERPTLKRLKKK